MAHDRRPANKVKELRLNRGWSQGELARRAGMSRTAVSAVEMDRLVPSVAAALGLAAALGCSVEELFGAPGNEAAEPAWAWAPPPATARYWHARVQNRILLYPVEATALGVVAHDGVAGDDRPRRHSRVGPEETLVVAGCDPAAALLATEYARTTGYRLLVLPRSSGQALDLLAHGLVHAAGIHLGSAGDAANAGAARSRLDGGVALLRAARWQEGLAVAPRLKERSVRGLLRAHLSWVGREPGSGARQCLDELFAGRPPPRRLAHDHQQVAAAVRAGWADIGVCLRLVCAEAGLDFVALREEAYDLCYPAGAEADPRLRGLIEVVRSAAYRRLLGELPGYDSSETGEIEVVAGNVEG
jgi:molybdate-binding protein/transcriptional regulator with XRE-family HTH domain